MCKDEIRAEKDARWAEEDLVTAREFAKNASPDQQAQARRMARDAKKRRARASRRVGRAICRDFDD